MILEARKSSKEQSLQKKREKERESKQKKPKLLKPKGKGNRKDPKALSISG